MMTPTLRVALLLAMVLAASTGEPAAQAPATPSPLALLLDQYASADQQAAIATLSATPDLGPLISRYERDGMKWVNTGPEPRVPHRRLVAATFVLEIAGVQRGRDWRRVRSLMEWACFLVRKGERTENERTWHLAAIALWHSTLLIDVDHLRHVAVRFSDDSRFPFTNVVLDEPMRGDSGFTPAVIRELRKFTGDPMVGAEAHLRVGRLLLDRGELTAALVELSQAGRKAGADTYVTSLAALLIGRVKEQQHQALEAEKAYRVALNLRPGMQSAALSLAAQLFQRGEPDQAYRVIDGALKTRPRPDDPWRSLGYGSYRHWPAYIARLREAVRQ